MSRPDADAIPDPTPIVELTTSYWASQTLFAANRIGLFEAIGDAAVSANEIAEKLGIAGRSTELLMNACASLDLLEKQDGLYRCSDLGAAYLLPGTQSYMGDAIRYCDDLYSTWGRLEHSVRAGEPALTASSYLGDDEQRTRNFVYGMHNRALGIGQALVGLADLGECRSLLDVGGGPGTYSALFAARYPGLSAQVMELPGVIPIAREILATMPAGDRVTMVEGNYKTSAFPAPVEAVLMSGMFHRETEQQCRELIAKGFDALTSGGRMVICDIFADAGGASPAFAALFGLTMLLTAPDGTVHADADVAAWMRDRGIAEVEVFHFPPPMPHRIVIGVKP
jgi:hypothetical protein